jgi:glycerate 2-kinase
MRPCLMKILIAPDKFKGSLSAREVAENIAAGLREVLPDARIDMAPMADGGEGTAEVICGALGGSWLMCKAHDPLGRQIEARYAYINSKKLAIMEMSEAAGMRRLSESERDPFRANTFGVGEMILNAAHRGASEIIIGLGGSATNDGGFGMARALGFRFLAGANELAGDVRDLQKLTRIVKPSPGPAAAGSAPLPRREDEGEGKPSGILCPSLPRITAAVDVRNPLLGENGATRVYGPQKGATNDKIDLLEYALAKLADVVAAGLGINYRDEPGAGAAGGLGFGLMSFCGATIRPGFDVIAESIGFESKVKNADVVITGEGSLDRQTLEGKTPAGVARVARNFGKRVIVVAGHASGDRKVRGLFDGVYELAQPGMSEQEQMKHAAELVRKKAHDLARAL